MPDGALKLDLDASLADDLRAAADACQMPVEDYVRTVLKREASEAADALGWNIDTAQDLADLKEFDETEEGIPWEEIKPWLKSLLTDDPLPRPQPRKLK